MRGWKAMRCVRSMILEFDSDTPKKIKAWDWSLSDW